MVHDKFLLKLSKFWDSIEALSVDSHFLRVSGQHMNLIWLSENSIEQYSVMLGRAEIIYLSCLFSLVFLFPTSIIAWNSFLSWADFEDVLCCFNSTKWTNVSVRMSHEWRREDEEDKNEEEESIHIPKVQNKWNSVSWSYFIVLEVGGANEVNTEDSAYSWTECIRGFTNLSDEIIMFTKTTNAK